MMRVMLCAYVEMYLQAVHPAWIQSVPLFTYSSNVGFRYLVKSGHVEVHTSSKALLRVSANPLCVSILGHTSSELLSEVEGRVIHFSKHFSCQQLVYAQRGGQTFSLILLISC